MLNDATVSKYSTFGKNEVSKESKRKTWVYGIVAILLLSIILGAAWYLQQSGSNGHPTNYNAKSIQNNVATTNDEKVKIVADSVTVDEVGETVDEVFDTAKEVKDTVGEVVETAQEVVDTVQDVEDTVQDVYDTAEDVAETAEDVNTLIDEINNDYEEDESSSETSEDETEEN